jgi:predicted nucleic acid-binding protein
LILVDTSVWVTHLRRRSPALQQLLQEGLVLTHPFVMGELACGHLKNRQEILGLFSALPEAKVAEQEEVLRFIEHYHLMGSGLGWVDAHVLTSAALTSTRLWTVDKSLAKAAEKLHLGYAPLHIIG